MKIWIEVNKYETAYLHTSEPNPSHSGQWGSGGWSSVVFSGEARNFFIKRLAKDTVAEFELTCIWERTA